MKRLIIGVSLVGLVAAGTIGLLVRGGSAKAASYRLVAVERGDIVSSVNATGTLNAVSTVQVGTQVSAQIAQLYVDFNDRVRRGQLVARLDTTLLVLAVEQSRAEVERSQADLEQKQFLLAQATRLSETASVTETEFRAAQYNAAAAQASLRSARTGLARAEQNLRYASIYAPIDGIVIERNVNVGQTVAASLSAPQLFLIAEDLSRMQILVSVDESDIGKIREGQAVHFTVQAYPSRTFNGAVRQVRMQSKTSENVVNYTVVVAVENADLALLPGMTATVSFEIARASAVLKVANAALRFRASETMLADWRAAHSDTAGPRLDPVRRAAPADSAGSRTPSGTTTRAMFAMYTGAQGGTQEPSPAGAPGAARTRTGGAGSLAAASQGAAEPVQLWYLDAAGRPALTFVRTGLTDGQTTEVVGPEVREGMRVIAGLATNGAAQAATTTNPFQSTRQQQMGPPPPPGGF
jgi:HlyD family secretion protein